MFYIEFNYVESLDESVYFCSSWDSKKMQLLILWGENAMVNSFKKGNYQFLKDDQKKAVQIDFNGFFGINDVQEFLA